MKPTKTSLEDFESAARTVKDNDVYKVLDISRLEHLVVSMTVLHPGKKTSGHSHAEADEVYMFSAGAGEMRVDEAKMKVREGDIVLIPRGAFHRVSNTSAAELVFVCVFEKYGDRV